LTFDETAARVGGSDPQPSSVCSTPLAACSFATRSHRSIPRAAAAVPCVSRVLARADAAVAKSGAAAGRIGSVGLVQMGSTSSLGFVPFGTRFLRFGGVSCVVRVDACGWCKLTSVSQPTSQSAQLDQRASNCTNGIHRRTCSRRPSAAWIWQQTRPPRPA
jgi:hypothetical protein